MVDQVGLVNLVGDRLPKRVISLVPSYTESLFELGLGETVVAVSDYCVSPEDTVGHLPRVGGPKSIRVSEVAQLNPDLVIANQEENTQQIVEAIENLGIPVWVSFPKTINEMIDDLYQIAGAFRSKESLQQVQWIERSVEWFRLSTENQPRKRYFCPIWQDRLDDGSMWWMTFNQNTYSSDLLGLLGGENVFSKRNRRYPLLAEFGILPEEAPGTRDTRYPRVSRQEVIETSPEIILLPDEPYAYRKDDVDQFIQWFSSLRATHPLEIKRIDGSLITWVGTRIVRAIKELSTLFLPM